MFPFAFACRHRRDWFLEKLRKNWVTLVKLKIPSDSWVVFWTNESEKQSITSFAQVNQKHMKLPYKTKIQFNDQKRKNLLIGENQVAMFKKGKNLLICKHNVTMFKKNFFTFHSRKKSLFSATSALSPQLKLMAYNTTSSMDMLISTDYLDFAICYKRTGLLSWSKIDPNYMDVKLKNLRKDENKDFRANFVP